MNGVSDRLRSIDQPRKRQRDSTITYLANATFHAMLTPETSLHRSPCFTARPFSTNRGLQNTVPLIILIPPITLRRSPMSRPRSSACALSVFKCSSSVTCGALTASGWGKVVFRTVDNGSLNPVSRSAGTVPKSVLYTSACPPDAHAHNHRGDRRNYFVFPRWRAV